MQQRGGDVTTIRIQWSEAEEKTWRIKNEDRLEVVAIETEIASITLPVAGTVSNFQFEIPDNRITELILEVDHLGPGEVITFKNIQSGEDLFTTAGFYRNRILLPAFDPSHTMMEWISRSGKYKSEFNIRNIYVHESFRDRDDRDIGFNTSLNCMINAACKQDSMMQLISKSAVRIRMVMDEGIGWCTGAFMNNTRNDKTPYILTAHHCTFEYTPQYDLWRFDLEYASDSCATPLNEPQRFSVTGCEKKATGQASDFLLVLLNEDVPAGIDVTFNGWNRDTVLTPDTTYAVHHPNADIRKLSTCVNKAEIHPTQIGWSEGYNTPGGHHLKFKFTEGGHQAGSSGAPVFDQDGYVIGQLHGGKSGCEASNNAFVGRFSKSWNLGASDSERLSVWLDPDQTGIMSLPATRNFNNADLVEVKGIVRDPKGRPINHVALAISGGTTDTVYTDAAGNFTLNNVNRNGVYEIKPIKNDHPLEGLSATDILIIQKHLLGKEPFTQPWQFIAGDVNNNTSVSATDLLVLLRLLLGQIPNLGVSHSWRFSPKFIELDTIPTGETVELEFQGIKIGDINTSANPGL